MMNEQIQQLLQSANSAIDDGDIGRAADEYQQVLASDPNNHEACLMLGSLLGEAGQLDQAASLLRKAAANKADDATACITLAHVLRAMGDTKNAIDSLEEGVRRDPDDCDAICTLGSMLAESGRDTEAVEQFSSAVELNPQRGDAWLALGAMQIRQNQPEAAAGTLETALRLNPGDREAKLQLGIALIKLERLDDAESILRQAITDHSDYPELYFWLANALKQRGNLSGALESNTSARALAPDSTAYRVQAAAIREDMGKTDEAFELLRPVLEVEAVPVEAALLFAIMSRTLGMVDEARNLLEKVSAHDSSPEQRNKIDDVLLWLESA